MELWEGRMSEAGCWLEEGFSIEGELTDMIKRRTDRRLEGAQQTARGREKTGPGWEEGVSTGGGRGQNTLHFHGKQGNG